MTSLAQLERGVVGYWCPMLATTGLVEYDRSVRKNRGTLTGMTAASARVTAKVRNTTGRVLDFDGSNDYVIGSQAFVGSAVTFSAWAKFDSNPANYPMLIQLRRSTGANATHCIQMLHRPNGDTFGGGSGSRIVFNVNTTADNSSFPSVALTANAWVHYVGTYNGATLALYKDGLFVQSAAFAGGISTGINELNIGNNRASVGDGYFDGQIAETCIWNRAITPSEIRTLYRIGPGWFGKRELKRRYSVAAAAFNRRRRVLLTAG